MSQQVPLILRSQKLIKDSLIKISKFATIVITTHEKTTMEIADEIFEISQGKSNLLKSI